jgi:hypothetical protein
VTHAVHQLHRRRRIKYLAFILGLATALSALGVEYLPSRVAAAVC